MRKYLVGFNIEEYWAEFTIICENLIEINDTTLKIEGSESGSVLIQVDEDHNFNVEEIKVEV